MTATLALPLRRLGLVASLGLALLLGLAATPSEAHAEDWYMELYEQAMFGVGGAPGGEAGLASRSTGGAALGFRFLSEDGHGFGLTFDFFGDFKGEQTPGFFNFATDIVYLHRANFLEHERFVFGLGLSLGATDASYDSRCPTSCTPEEDAVGAAYDAHDSFMIGGVMTLGVDHPLEDADDSLYVGVELITHVMAATSDDALDARWNVSAAVHFGGRFEL